MRDDGCEAAVNGAACSRMAESEAVKVVADEVADEPAQVHAGEPVSATIAAGPLAAEAKAKVSPRPSGPAGKKGESPPEPSEEDFVAGSSADLGMPVSDSKDKGGGTPSIAPRPDLSGARTLLKNPCA